ncbi:MAG: LPS-assembly protein LptD [Candidatus Rokubacteria bacterium]|nr:LPS-assembly protein LptD [Candidatus Rokubacteria bacterium]
MPGTRLIRLVVTGLCCILPAVVLAQERRELTIGSAEAPVTVFADRIENLERERLLIAEGRVEIEQGEVRLEADRVEVNTETGEAVAAGRVVFFDGRDRLLGERLEYNFRTGTGVVYRAEAFAEPHFFFRGDRMERFGEKAYRLQGGWLTTCEGEAPAWHVRWGQATAYLDDWIWGTNASFWVGRVPLIPFIPVFSASLRKDRHSGLLAPSFGTSNDKGFTYRQPIFWAISDSQDLTLVPTYFEKRGLALGGSYRYIRRETSRGELEGFGLDDTERKEMRGVVGFRHEEELTPGLILRADLARVSDDDYFRDFGNMLDERSRQRLESNLSLTDHWGSWNLFGRLFYYQDLTTRESVELHRLPEIRLTAFSQPVVASGILLDADTGILFDLESSYNNFVRGLGADGQRLDLRPRLSYPVSPGGYFTVTPRIAAREILYDTTVVGTKVERGFLVEDTRKELVSRSLFEAGMDLEARAFRVFDLGGAFGIQRVQHAIEPRVGYSYASEIGQEDVPQFDGTDGSIGSTNTLTYSLTNRVKARGVPTDADPTGRVWELLRLTFSQTWNLEEPPQTVAAAPINLPAPAGPIPPSISVKTPRLSALIGDLIFEPAFGLRFRGTAAFDPYERDVLFATTDVTYETRDFRATFGTRHGLGGELQFIQGELQARLSPRWAVRFASNYDLLSETVVENRLEVEFREQCWAISVAFIDRTNEDEFRITINLLELGQYGFGRAFGAQ